MLKLEKINTFYGAAHILFDLSLEVKEGETVCLFGRNGAGKTTTLKSILGLTPPRSGRIIFKDKEITGLPTYEIANRGIGFVPEDRRIFPSLTVHRNLEVGRKSGGDGGKELWNFETIYQHFPQLKMLESHLGEHLSGGEQRILSIARTLMGNPELILLDEPTEGLAPLIVKEIMKIIGEIRNKGLSILLVEQHSEMALAIADRCYVIDKGHMVYEGKAQELRENKALKKDLLGV